MAIAMALLGFNDLGRSVTPTFLYKTILFTIFYTLSKNEQKNQCGKVKNITITVHGASNTAIRCGRKARETVVAKCELVFLRNLTSCLKCLKRFIDQIGPFIPYLAENISLQS